MSYVLQKVFVDLLKIQHMDFMDCFVKDAKELHSLVENLSLSIQRDNGKSVLIWKSESGLGFVGCPITEQGIQFSLMGVCDTTKRLYESTIVTLKETQPKMFSVVNKEINAVKEIFLTLSPIIGDYFK
jgi:hypothetical protein